jgi:uncharacterized protein
VFYETGDIEAFNLLGLPPIDGNCTLMITMTRAIFDDFISRKFGMIVVQPTTFCPWACDYCYLTTKDRKFEMSPEVAQAIARSVQLQDGGDAVDLVWHGGEPLALGLDRFTNLLKVFEPLRREGRVRHAVQTSAGLITAQWCDLFAKHKMSVGVSIDGPDWANSLRRDKSGRPAYGRIMRGIETLKENGVPFNVIGVVTAETADRPDEIVDFFESLGALNIGFNIEEREGANNRRTIIDRTSATVFWRSLFRRRAANPSLRIREIDLLLSYLRGARNAQEHKPFLIEPMPTVAWNGDTVILSPELAGIKDPAYGDFIVGNVLDTPLPAILGTAHEAKYVNEYLGALTSCAQNCEFYEFCRGLQAGNRYFEHGTFEVSETMFCINTRQALVESLNDLINQPEVST